MHKEGDEVHVDTEEASGGSKEGVVRWVLLVGLVLAIGLLSAIWIFGAASQGDVESEVTVSGNMDAMEDDNDTDGLVGNRLDEMDADADLEPVDGVAPATIENETEN